MIELLTLSIAGAFGLIGFFSPAVLLHISGFEVVQDMYRMLIKQQSRRPLNESLDLLGDTGTSHPQ